MDRTSDFDLMKHNLTDIIEFTKIIIDYDGFNPTTDFWQPLVTTYFKLIDLPTDHDSHDGSHPIQGGRPLGVGRASGENHGSPSFILAYLQKAGRYRRTACIPSWKFQRIRGHRGQRTSKRPLDA